MRIYCTADSISHEAHRIHLPKVRTEKTKIIETKGKGKEAVRLDPNLEWIFIAQRKELGVG